MLQVSNNIDDNECLDAFIAELRSIDRLKWSFMSSLQLIFYPFSLLRFNLPRWLRSNQYLRLDDKQIHVKDVSIYVEFGIVNRRKSENRYLRAMYDTLVNRFKYHTMPVTMKVQKLEDIA